MTPTEYRAAIKELGLSPQDASEFFGVTRTTGWRWANEDDPPAPVAKFLRLMLALRFTPEYVDRVLAEESK